MAFNYNQLTVTTREHILPKVVDQIFSKDPILNELKKKKKVVDGGRSFVVNIKTDTLIRGKFGADSTFDVAKKQIHDKVELPVRGHYANLTIDHADETQNKGKAQIINMLQTKMEDLEEAIRQELLDQLYGDPATVDPGNAGFIGLKDGIVDNNNTYAGIDRTLAGFEYWKSVVKEDTTGTTPLSLTYSMLRDFYMKVTDGGKDGKNLVFVADFNTVSQIETILANRNQIQSRDNGLANLGFADFTLFGKKVYASSELENIAAAEGQGTIYALNFDYLTLHTLQGSDFHLTKFKEDRNSALKSAQLLVQGNFVATKPKALGRISDIAFA